ncbi:MAG: hypothetical protein AAFO75_11215, partial [Pseudomonadota bacterium]
MLRAIGPCRNSAEIALTKAGSVDTELPVRIADTMIGSAQNELKERHHPISDQLCHTLARVDDPMIATHATADDVNADLVVLGVPIFSGPASPSASPNSI